MSPAPRSPLDGADRVVVDGTNLLHRIGRAGSPPATVVGRLRAAIPADITIELVFDGVGHGVTGRVAQQMHVRYSGRRTADDAILELVGDAAGPSGPGAVAAARTLVVSDDRALRTTLTARGARTAGLAWLLGRLDLPAASPSTGKRAAPIGSGRPPAGSAGPAVDAERDERPGWKPGRGATSKTGPAHKVARHRRHPKHP